MKTLIPVVPLGGAPEPADGIPGFDLPGDIARLHRDRVERAKAITADWRQDLELAVQDDQMHWATGALAAEALEWVDVLMEEARAMTTDSLLLGEGIASGAPVGVLSDADRAITLASAILPPLKAGAAAVKGVKRIALRRDEYIKALSRVFPSHHLDKAGALVDDIGQVAAKIAKDDAVFRRHMGINDTKRAGHRFHQIAEEVLKEVAEGRSPTIKLPAGWRAHAELTTRPGKGGSRLDVLLVDDMGKVMIFDWKPSGRSAVTSSSRRQAAKHKASVVNPDKGTSQLLGSSPNVVAHESRSWQSYMRVYAQEWGGHLPKGL